MKRQRILMGLVLFSTIFTVGITSVAAKDISGSKDVVISQGTAATPSDSSEEETGKKTKEKKDKKKKTETTTETSTVQPQTNQASTTTPVDAAELAEVTAAYSKTLQEKREIQERLNLIMENQNDFIKRLHEIDDLIISYQGKIDDINNRTMQIQGTMGSLQDEIDEAQALQDAQYDKLKQQITEEYENNSYGYLDALFNSVDYTDVVNKTEYIQAVDSYNNNILGQYKNVRTRLEDKKAMLTMITESISILEHAYQDEQETLEILSEEKIKQIDEFQESIDKTQAEMSAIESIEAEQTARIAAIEAKYNVSVTVGTPTTVQYNGADFLWPMPTSTTISSYYGPRTAPTAGASSFHKGIDIPCPIGSGVIAVADGTVAVAEYRGTTGNCVSIHHGNGLFTRYYHLSAFNCKVGDTVTAGQTIGFSGNTGVSTSPHLHFAVYENGKDVNPLKYYKNVKDKSQVANTEGSN